MDCATFLGDFFTNSSGHPARWQGTFYVEINCLDTTILGGQGDQIGRIFAQWAIVCLSSFFK
jgi:hypothetical protein